MYIPDTIEIMEASAERWAEENIVNSDFLCSCGKLCSLQDGQTISSNPYANPVCHECFQEWYDYKTKEAKDADILIFLTIVGVIAFIIINSLIPSGSFSSENGEVIKSLETRIEVLEKFHNIENEEEK